MNQGLRIVINESDKQLIRMASAKLGLTMSAFGRNTLVRIAEAVMSGDLTFFTEIHSQRNRKNKLKEQKRASIEPEAQAGGHHQEDEDMEA